MQKNFRPKIQWPRISSAHKSLLLYVCDHVHNVYFLSVRVLGMKMCKNAACLYFQALETGKGKSII